MASRRVNLQTTEEPAKAPVVHSPDSGTITVTVARDGNTTERKEKLEVPKFVGPVALVRLGGSVTRNMGNYNSARVEVSIEMPCYPVEAEVMRTYENISKMVDGIINTEMEVTGMNGGGNVAG